jgi:hypothetical protein
MNAPHRPGSFAPEHARESDAALFAWSFRERPVFRMRFDAHVRQWDRFMRRQVWRAFHTRPSFAAEYQRRVEASFRDEWEQQA